MIKVLHRRFAPSTYDRALVMLAQAQCPLEIWRPILLWHITRDEFLLRDFVVRWLASEFEVGRYATQTARRPRLFRDARNPDRPPGGEMEPVDPRTGRYRACSGWSWTSDCCVE